MSSRPPKSPKPFGESLKTKTLLHQMTPLSPVGPKSSVIPFWVRVFIVSQVDFARDHGYVTTLSNPQILRNKKLGNLNVGSYANFLGLRASKRACVNPNFFSS